ncbi:RNA polymerase sigma factor [Naasia aerilata]|uniref:RNA polymerase sigma factor n=1 Tax=Naasia aerilata TaxID=1162966 RepID=A0ABN6XHG5_9MICO|nr:RNA polymerase sigma factor [Naasia aerilata]BDZ44322.1 RNA polymerase sigma factor [Naasia aerilata]
MSSAAGAPRGGATQAAIEAVWRIESAKVLGALARTLGGFDEAEEFAQDALVQALEQWPRTGIPRNPAAWLTTVARRRAVDSWRRRVGLDERHAELGHRLEVAEQSGPEQLALEPLHDEVLRLIFVACHPVLARPSRVALTLRMVGGLSTDEIARAFLVPSPTMGQRISRAKRSIAEAGVPFEVPDAAELPGRLGAVLEVIYLIFNEGYSASGGADLLRPDLCREALRLGRVLASLLPRESEVFALVALMELQMSRFAARTDAAGDPVVLPDQDRRRWDRTAIARGREALGRARQLAPELGSYGLQAELAECHAVAVRAEDTDWSRIVRTYDRLFALTPSPVVELNRAVAVAMSGHPEEALAVVDELAARPGFGTFHLVSGVRADLLARLGREQEARAEFLRAAELAGNERVKAMLMARAAVPAER